MAAIDPVRNAAIDVLMRVFRSGAYINVTLDRALQRANISERGGRFMTQLVYGTVRHKILCDHIIAQRLTQPMGKLPDAILIILRMGVFQALFCNQVTFPAMVHTSVDLAQKWGHSGTARLVNAILRRVPQSIDEVKLPDHEENLVDYLSVRYSLPDWMVQRWVDEHGAETAEALCDASNTEAPVTVRANTLKTPPDELMATLIKRGLGVEKATPVPEELTITAGSPMQTKLFGDGHYCIQDAASMLPAHLLEPEAGCRVLDLCAGLGMKTTHIAALSGNQAHIVAADPLMSKLNMLRDNAADLGADGIEVVCADGLTPPFEVRKEGQPAGSMRPGLADPALPCFDRVLVDAPCSGWGTLRRHPDLKWRARPDDPARLAELQSALLRSAVGLCKNGGLIVYSVCTFTREEMDSARAILTAGNVEPEDGPQWLNQWKIDRGQYRVLPEKRGLDGFFLMRLRKVS